MESALNPPELPPFLAETFELKAIEGVPSDDEVKVVHAVIRALGEVANVPRLYDPDLSMRLAQYLFNIQMARYREKFPMVAFPGNTTHTPPALPVHIPVDLKLVVGPPSDEDVKDVQEALRLAENLANVPSMFDPNLSMQLSQHLFNIQFERYIHQVVIGHNSHSASSRNERHDQRIEGSVHPVTDASLQSENSNPLTPAISRDELEPAEPLAHSQISLSSLPFEPELNSDVEQKPIVVKGGMEESNKLLSQVIDRLDDMKRFMQAAQYGMAMSSVVTEGCHVFVDGKGEFYTEWRGVDYFELRRSLEETPDLVNRTSLANYLANNRIGGELYGQRHGSWGTSYYIMSDKVAEAVAVASKHMGLA